VVGKQNVHRFVRKWLQCIWEDRLRGHFDKGAQWPQAQESSAADDAGLTSNAVQAVPVLIRQGGVLVQHNRTWRHSQVQLAPKRMLEYINLVCMVRSSQLQGNS
jgi:hypothetical protein